MRKWFRKADDTGELALRYMNEIKEVLKAASRANDDEQMIACIARLTRLNVAVVTDGERLKSVGEKREAATLYKLAECIWLLEQTMREKL